MPLPASRSRRLPARGCRGEVAAKLTDGARREVPAPDWLASSYCAVGSSEWLASMLCRLPVQRPCATGRVSTATT